MARHRFGGTTNDYVGTVDSNGFEKPQANNAVTFYLDAALTKPATDLTNVLGTAISTVTTSPLGYLPMFFGPDGVTEMYDPSARLLVANDLAAQLAQVAAATVTSVDGQIGDVVLTSRYVPVSDEGFLVRGYMYSSGWPVPDPDYTGAVLWFSLASDNAPDPVNGVGLHIRIP